MTVDLSNPAAVLAEAERRNRLRAEGRPLTDGGGVARALEPSRGGALAPPSRSGGIVSIGSPPLAWRRGDVLWLRIHATARSKKNSTMLGIKKSPGYVRFRNAVVAMIEPFAGELRLPLPAIDYNCAARFFMETDAADTDNLMSGLADALQDAGVLADDWHIRTWNGSDRLVDPLRPRVEVTLTPYTEQVT